MDSLTQALLGATTFALIKDKDIGKKSLLIGAIAGTLPDLDVLLFPFFNDIEFLTVHRSVSHSIGLAIILSFIFASIFHNFYQKKYSFYSWLGAFFFAISTHSLLDWCTTYGTKFLSPFSAHLFSTNNIHTIEPIYTCIFLVGLTLFLFKKQTKIVGQKTLKYTLIVSTIYLSWTFLSKGIANQHFVKELKKQNIIFEKLMVTPTPLNSVLWHGIVKTKEGYYVATYSLFDRRESIEFQFEKSEHNLISRIENNRLVKYYLQYTQDYPLVRIDDFGNIKIYALKFGPINYFGKPEFVYPLCLNINELIDKQINIDYSGKKRGPVKNYKNLIRRIKGI